MPTRGDSGSSKKKPKPAPQRVRFGPSALIPPAPPKKPAAKLPNVWPKPVQKMSHTDKQAVIWAAEQNLKPWEVRPSPTPTPRAPRVPLSKKKQPPSAPMTQTQRARIALAAPVSSLARRHLGETMTPKRRAQYDASYKPPPKPTSLLHAITSTPGSILDTWERMGRGAEKGAGIAGMAIGAPIARKAIETAYGLAGYQPQNSYSGIPREVQAAAAGAKAGTETLGEWTVGPQLTAALGRPAYAQPMIPARLGAKAGLALDVALVPTMVGGKPVRFGRAMAEGLLAAREAENLAHGRAAFSEAFESAMGGPMLPAKVIMAAKQNRALRGQPLRSTLHEVIDQVSGDAVLARKMKGEADGYAHLAALSKPAGPERKAEVARVYQDYLTAVQHMPVHPIAGFDPVVSEAKGLTNLARSQKVDKIEAQAPKSAPHVSGHVPKATDKGIAATGQQVVGEISPEDWWLRVQHSVGGDAALGLSLAHWYRELGPLFRTIFKEDGNAVLRGFATSQANASPAGGLLNVLRVRDKILNHEAISPTEISTVVKSIEAAYKGEPVEKGLQAKLHDFAASLEGKKTRSWTLDDIAGGAPVAIDVHAARDLGWIDKKILNTLRTRHKLPVAHLQLQKLEEELKTLVGRKKLPGSKLSDEVWQEAHDLAVAKKEKQLANFKAKNKGAIKEGLKSGLVLDNPAGSPAGFRYEAGRRRYEAIAEYLNQVDGGIGAWGKSDWTPAEAQALGWSAIQRVHGVTPEDAMYAIRRNTYTVALEALNKDTSMGLVGFDSQMAVTRETVDRILPSLVEEENGYLRSIEYGSGSSGETVVPSAQITVVATPEQVDRMIIRLGGMFGKHDVEGMRVGVSVSKKGLGKAALEIQAPEFKDAARAGVFWHQLLKELPAKYRRHFDSYTTFTRDGKTGIRIVTKSGPVSAEKSVEWGAQFGEAIDAAGSKVGLDKGFVYNTVNVEVRSHTTAKATRKATATLRRAGRLPGMGDPLEAEARQTLGAAITRHREAEGNVAPVTEFRATGAERMGPEEEAWRRAHPYRTPEEGGALPTYGERLDRAAAEAKAARAAWETEKEAAQKARYAELRAEDKAAGKDVSGKSVQQRKMFAYDDVGRDPRIRALAQEMDAAETRLRELKNPPAPGLAPRRAVPPAKPGEPAPPVTPQSLADAAAVGTPARFQVEARLAEIDKMYDGMVDKMTAGYEPGKTGKSLQAQRNARAKKVAKSGRPKQKTVTQEARALAEKRLLDVLERNDTPEVQWVNAQLDEAARLRAMLADDELMASHLPPEARQIAPAPAEAALPPEAPPPEEPPAPPEAPPPSEPPPPPPEGPPLGPVDLPGEARNLMRGQGEGTRLRRETKRLRSEESAVRTAEYNRRIKEGSDQWGNYTEETKRYAMEALAGEMPRLDWERYTEMSPQAVDALIYHIRTHPSLQGLNRTYTRINTEEALRSIVAGQVPRKFEQRLLRDVFGEFRTQQMIDSIEFWAKWRRRALNFIGIPRTLMASVDLSAPLRQGLLFAVSHPVLWKRNMAPMIKSAFSQGHYDDVMAEIARRPNFDLYEVAGVPFTDLGARMEKRDEAFMSSYAERIPIGGHLVKGSNRAYNAFLNKSRADYMDWLIEQAHNLRPDIDLESDEGVKMLKDFARVVGNATGRGTIKNDTIAKALPLLNQTLFAPRLLKSRIDVIANPLYYLELRKNPVALKEALKQLAGLAIAVSGVATMAKLAGADVLLDPRQAMNSDWMKVKIGNTRFDIAGGFQQPVRLLAQMYTATVISSTTGKKIDLTSGKYGALDRLAVLARFGETKLAPAPSFVVDFFKGTDFAGQPFEWKKAVIQRMAPLLAQDIIDTARDDPTMAAFVTSLGMWGIGAQTYGPKPVKPSGSGDPFSGSGADPFSGAGVDPFGGAP